MTVVNFVYSKVWCVSIAMGITTYSHRVESCKGRM